MTDWTKIQVGDRIELNYKSYYAVDGVSHKGIGTVLWTGRNDVRVEWDTPNEIPRGWTEFTKDSPVGQSITLVAGPTLEELEGQYEID